MPESFSGAEHPASYTKLGVSEGHGGPEPGGTAPAGPPGPATLPCLNSNKWDKEEGVETAVAKWNVLSGNHKKTAFALGINVQRFIGRYGLEKVGFLTLTFGDHVVSAREAQRRLHNFLRRHRHRWSGWIIVFERMKSFRVHFHLLLAMGEDIRSGFDFEAASRGDYRSAGKRLRSEWAWFRRILPGYGFGRSELLPLRKDKDVVALYVGKYIAKSIGKREEKDKGVRLVRYSRGSSVASPHFQFVSKGSARWRRRVGELAAEMGIDEYGEWSERFGPKWAWAIGNLIANEVEETEEVPAQPVTIENASGKVVYWGDTFRTRKFDPSKVVKRQGAKPENFERSEVDRHRIEETEKQNSAAWADWRAKGGWLPS